MLKLTLIALVFASFSAFADAFDDGKWEFSQIQDAHREALATETLELRMEIWKLEKLREANLAEKEKCSDFECAKREQVEIDALDAKLADQKETLRKHSIAIETRYDKLAKAVALKAVLAELKSLIAADPRFSLVVDRGDSDCRSRFVQGSTGDTECKQLNLEFKFSDGKFYKIETAFGLRLRFRNITGGIAIAHDDQPTKLFDVATLFSDRRVLLDGIGPDLVLKMKYRNLSPLEGSNNLRAYFFNVIGFFTVLESY